MRESIGPRRTSRSNGLFLGGVTSFFRRNWAATRSILFFGGCILVFMFVYSKIADGEQMIALSTLTANATGFILNLLAFKTQVIGTWISSADFSMNIVAACTGIVPMAIVVFAVIAYPSSIRDKGKGIVLCIVGLFAINLVRMVGLFVVGTYVPSFFDVAHYVVGQSLMILLAIALWLFWREKWVHATTG